MQIHGSFSSRLPYVLSFTCGGYVGEVDSLVLVISRVLLMLEFLRIQLRKTSQ